MLRQLIVIVSMINIIKGDNEKWNYDSIGSNEWKKLYEECNGRQQSPINILKEQTMCNSSVKPLKLDNLNGENLFKFKNNGHTVVATPFYADRFQLQTSGSGLPSDLEPFELEQIHFHWGLNKYEGSEHLINDKLFALELHFVHGSTVNRKQKAVLGVLFQAVKKDTPNLSQISKIAGMLVNTSNPEFDATLNLTFVMPSDRTRFYYYKGSLTTPPCSETVYWTVFASPVEINEEYLNDFYVNTVKHNYRNPQELYGRTILTRSCELASNHAARPILQWSTKQMLFFLSSFILCTFILS